MHIDSTVLSLTSLSFDGRGSVARATAFLRDARPIPIVM